MHTQRIWGMIVAIGLLVAFQLYGLAELSKIELPNATLVGTLYSEYTQQPLRNMLVEITSERFLDEPPREREQQGWQERQYSTPSTWQVYTDSQGRFQVRGLPPGNYYVQCRSEVHTLSKQTDEWQGQLISLRSGQTLAMEFWARTRGEYLDAIHPQSVYTPDEPIRLGVRGFVKDDQLRLRLYALTIQPDDPQFFSAFYDLRRLQYGWWESSAVWEGYIKRLDSYVQLVNERTYAVRGRDPEGAFIQYLDLPTALEEGIYIAEVRSQRLVRPLMVMVSSVGLVAKNAPNLSEVWCVDLRTGQPVAGVPVSCVNMGRTSAEPSTLIARASSDPNGIVRLKAQGTTYLVAQNPRTGRVIQWVEAHPFREEEVELTGTLYTERPIYRPGQTISFKGIFRQNSQEGYALPAEGMRIQVELKDPDGETVQERTLRLNEFGSINDQFSIDPDAPTGFYTLSARLETPPGRPVPVTDTYVPVSAYRKPTMRVEVRPSSDLYLPDETVLLEIRTEYYFGMPTANTNLYVSILRQPTYLSYGSPVEGEESESVQEWDSGDYGQLVHFQEARTDAQGRLRLRIPARSLMGDTTGVTDPVPFLVKVEALSEGRESAKGEARLQIAPSEWRILYEAGQWFGEVGTPFTYTVRVIANRTGRPVQTTLRWSAGEQLWEGRTQRFYERTAGTIRTDAEGYATFQFTPTQPGDWLVRVETTDPRNRSLRQEDYTWVMSRGSWSDFSTPQDTLLEVRAQKRAYAPGETAEIAIRSRLRDAVYYVSLEGNQLYRTQVVPSQGAITRVALPIHSEQIPSAYISVCMVHRKRFYQRTVPIRVRWSEGALQLSIRTDKERYQPRETVQAEIRATDPQGNPVRAELSLAVVDESIYAIREDNPKRLSQAFYSQRYNKVNTVFSAPWLALQGDKGSAETPRRDFPDTAFWLPDLTTNEQGVARVQFRLPDSLTEWRLTVNGHTARTQVGYAKASIKASKDLMVRLRLPMWLVEGDRAELSAIVSNETDQPHTVQVVLQTPNQQLPTRVNVPARGSQVVRWNYEAKTPGNQVFTVSARAENAPLSDSELRTLLVKPAIWYRTTSSTRLVQGEQTFTFRVVPDTRLEQSRLELYAYPSLDQLLEEPVDYLLNYEHLCAEQTTSRFLPALLWLRAQEAEGVEVPQEKREKILRSVQLGIQQLRELRSYDGGWTWMGDGEGYLWLTAYVMGGLHQARLAGVEVPDWLFTQGLDALRQQTSERLNRLQGMTPPRGDSYRYRELLRDTAFGLRTLSELGETPDKLGADLLSKIKPILQTNDPAVLADVLLALGHWRTALRADDILRTLWQRLLNQRNETPDFLLWSSSQDQDWGWEWKAQEIQALCLKALVLTEPLAVQAFGSKARYDEVLDKTALALITWMLDNNRYSSRDVALGVLALLDYSQARKVSWVGGAAGTLEVEVNARRRWQLDANPRKSSVINLREALQAGENTVRVRSQGGLSLVSVRLVEARPLNAGLDGRNRAVQVRLYALDERTNRARPIRPNDLVSVGTLIRVEAEVRMPTDIPRFQFSVLEVPYAGGIAPLDTEYFLREAWWSPNTAELRDDRALAYREEWHRGERYQFSFVVRAEVPGDYTILPAFVWGMYSDFEGYGEPLRLRIRDR